LAFQTVDVERLRPELGAVQWLPILVAAVLLCVMRMVMSKRIQLVSTQLGHRIRYPDVLGMVMTSSFAAYVIPGGIATDIAMGFQLRQRHGDTKTAIATVTIDRFFGVLSILLVGVTAALCFRGYFPPWILYAFCLLFVGVLAIPIVGKYFLRYMPYLPSFLTKVTELVGILIREVRFGASFSKLLTLSLGIQLMRCCVFVCLFMAFDTNVSPVYAFLFVPVLFISIMLPLSLGGLGLRESILVFLFVPLGGSAEALILAGLLAHFLELVTLLPAVWYLIGSRSQRPENASLSASSRP